MQLGKPDAGVVVRPRLSTSCRVALKANPQNKRILVIDDLPGSPLEREFSSNAGFLTLNSSTSYNH